MKYTFCVKRPKYGEANNEIVKMAKVLLKGGIVHWGKAGKVKAFTEPLHNDGTPAIELGYINMLVEAPFLDYLRDKIKFRKRTIIEEGWPKMMPGQPKRYPRV